MHESMTNKNGALMLNVWPTHFFLSERAMFSHSHPSLLANRADLCTSHLERDFVDLSRNLFTLEVDLAIARKSNISLWTR